MQNIISNPSSLHLSSPKDDLSHFSYPTTTQKMTIDCKNDYENDYKATTKTTVKMSTENET